MTQAVLRTHFNTSHLIRLLADLVPANAAPSQQEFAQRLGQWVIYGRHDAVRSAQFCCTVGALGANCSRCVRRLGLRPCGVGAHAQRHGAGDPAQLRRSAGFCPHKIPVPPIETGPDIAISYAPFLRFCVTVQREMDSGWVRCVPLYASTHGRFARFASACRVGRRV
ncbi:MAG: DUF3348 family protein [Rhodoferax sp.]|nr:DUF3348 family protein [Rhodoferax sp.]